MCVHNVLDDTLTQMYNTRNPTSGGITTTQSFHSPVLRCMRCCERSYEPCESEEKVGAEADPNRLVIHDICDMYVECVMDKENGNVTISVRGTDSFSDVLHDLNIWKCAATTWHDGKLCVDNTSDCRVHRGFNKCAAAVCPRIAQWVETRDGNVNDVYITGHSLGGAVATLLAYQLHGLIKARDASLQVVTFGCPRVGNHAFMKTYNNTVHSHFRFTTINDIISCVPTFNYYHVGHSVYLDDQTSPWSSYLGVPMPNTNAHKLSAYRYGIQKLYGIPLKSRLPTGGHDTKAS